MSRRARLFCVVWTVPLAALSVPMGAHAQEVLGALETAFRNFTINPGVAVSSSVLRVTRRSDGWQGDISDTPGRLSFDLNLVVLDYRIPKSDWGLALHSNSGSYSADKQAVSTPDNSEGEFTKLGTRVDGYFSYLVPALYYVTNEPGTFFESGKLGGGIGYGAVRFNGDIILAPDRNPSLGQERVNASGGVKKAFTFVLYYALRQKEGLEFRVSVTTTRFKDSDYKFSAEEFRMTLSMPFVIFK